MKISSRMCSERHIRFTLPYITPSIRPELPAEMTTRLLKNVVVMASVTLAVLMLSGCASDGSSSSGGLDSRGSAGGGANPADRILACKATDRQVGGPQQCLQGDAACYQISNGNWCTGDRSNACPAGSTALPAGTACPVGARCFRLSESLECLTQ